MFNLSCLFTHKESFLRYFDRLVCCPDFLDRSLDELLTCALLSLQF